jgi:hypothetical protein
MIAQLLPLPLALLRHRFPYLLDHPALLAHTVYQTVVFDDSIRQNGFEYARTWKALHPKQHSDNASSSGDVADGEWIGLTEEVLGTDNWFERWLSGEKKCEYLPSYAPVACRY